MWQRTKLMLREMVICWWFWIFELINHCLKLELLERIQKLWKTAQLEPTDLVDVYYKPMDDGKNLVEIVQSQDQYIRDALGNPLIPKMMAPPDAVMICEESHNVQDMSFVIYIARVSPVVTDDLLVQAAGTREHFDALKVYLLSRSISRLKNEFQAGNGKITVELDGLLRDLWDASKQQQQQQPVTFNSNCIQHHAWEVVPRGGGLLGTLVWTGVTGLGVFSLLRRICICIDSPCFLLVVPDDVWLLNTFYKEHKNVDSYVAGILLLPLNKLIAVKMSCISSRP